MNITTPRSEKKRRADAERLSDIFTHLQRCFMSNLSKELSPGNVSFPQYFLLGYLVHQGPLSMSEIAERMNHTTAAATGMVDRLERLQCVRRFHVESDRRKIMVEATAPGIGLVNKVREDMVSNVIRMMGELTGDEQRAWLRIYEKIYSFCQAK